MKHAYHITGVVRAWWIWREQGQHKQATHTVEVDVRIAVDIDERWAIQHALWNAVRDGGYDHGQWETPPTVQKETQ